MSTLVVEVCEVKAVYPHPQADVLEFIAVKGWQVIVQNGVTLIDHSGSDPAAHSLAFFVPSKGIAVVAFTNGDNGHKAIIEIVRRLGLCCDDLTGIVARMRPLPETLASLTDL